MLSVRVWFGAGRLLRVVTINYASKVLWHEFRIVFWPLASSGHLLIFHLLLLVDCWSYIFLLLNSPTHSTVPLPFILTHNNKLRSTTKSVGTVCHECKSHHLPRLVLDQAFRRVKPESKAKRSGVSRRKPSEWPSYHKKTTKMNFLLFLGPIQPRICLPS